MKFADDIYKTCRVGHQQRVRGIRRYPARKIKQAMEAIEEYKPELDGILPKDEYFALTRTSNTLLVELLKNFSRIPADANGDIFGKIYEFFLAGISGLTGFSRCTASMCWIAKPRSRKS